MKNISKKIIIGSKSPRRKLLVEQLGLLCEVRTAEVDEVFPSELPVREVSSYLARLKAQPLKNTLQEDEILLTSDTIVVHRDIILHKPKNTEEAHEMLRLLSNDMHEVITGVNLYSKHRKVNFKTTTKVFFKHLLEEEIEYYVRQFQPFDKAGGYGIQEWIGMIGVSRLDGDFYNVMGLPVNRVWEVLRDEFF